jgi:thiosulfate/3-mercaptopyruvate sulfurtransferase
LLRAHGHGSVSLLDGGIPRWKAEGRPITQDVARPASGNFVSRWNPATVVTLDETRQAIRSGSVVVDARPPERYRGDVEPIDPRPGHIPGAVNAPVSANLADGLFLPAEKLRERYAPMMTEASDVIASCGSGVTACHDLFAMDLAGIRPFPKARLYVGSYSEWSRKCELPVTTGPSKGEAS